MDHGELDRNGKYVEKLSAEQLFPPHFPDISDIFGDPQMLPRVGTDYQVEIPPLMTESERLQLLRNPADNEMTFDVSHHFLVGLPIPLMWVDDKTKNHENGKIRVNKKPGDSVKAKGSLGSKKAKKSQLLSKKKSLAAKTLDVASDNGKKFKRANSKTAMAGKSKPDQICKGKSCCLVPGLLGDSSWTDVEVNSFLLAVYIFEKNLIQVKRFMESKEMGDILSFYYGKFYESDEHRRYSVCRRMLKSRKCKIGQRIFTGWRQQELLSRLLPHVSEEAKSSLVEVSKSFAEGRTSLEDYVHTLKTAVGIPILIEAVGIGKGKKDLTNLATEPTKNNQVFPVQPEIPVGKACSSLTSSDIIKFLTGDFRLSKARSNDIFWEAVWPRLLARGWHSEQPKNHGWYGPKHQLVFLMPGVKKFSKRKLVKGDHYFDSVSDVLRRVASAPDLIELEAEVPLVSSCKESNQKGLEPTLDYNETDDHQQHCYLKPRVSTCSPNPTMLTIVDTSLSCEEKSLKVREVRILPADTKNTFSLNIHLKETEGDSYGDSVAEPMSADMLKVEKKIKSCNYAKGIVDNSNSNQRRPIDGSKVAKKLVENNQDHDTVLFNDEQSKIIENQLIPRARPACLNVLPPLMKRRRLASCVKDDTSCSIDKFMVSSGLKEVEPRFMLNSPDVSDAGPFCEKVSLCSSSEHGSPKKESSDDTLRDNIYGIEMASIKNEKPQSRPLIDLNVPQIPLDLENGEFCMMELDDSLQNPNAHVLCVSSDKYKLVEPKILSKSIDIIAAEKLPVGNPRRQGTRNRPLTTKALEALASGFLGTKRTRKCRESQMQDSHVSRPSHRAYVRATLASNSASNSTGVVDDKEGNGEGGVWNGNKNRVSDPLVEIERKAAQELVGISKSSVSSRSSEIQ